LSKIVYFELSFIVTKLDLEMTIVIYEDTNLYMPKDVYIPATLIFLKDYATVWVENYQCISNYHQH